MPRGYLPLIDPSSADRMGSFIPIMAGTVSVLDHQHDPGVEILPRVIDIGLA